MADQDDPQELPGPAAPVADGSGGDPDDEPGGIEQHPSVLAGIKGRAFWMLCTMEMWERLAYYGVRVVMPVYIAQADEPGGLHFQQEDKGSIYAVWAIFQSVLPTFTGGFADRYGYKKNIVFSVTLKVAGYLLMATQRSYWGFLLGVVVLATGTAQFKPAIQGSLAQCLREGKTSVGWGIFYWLVNVGAMIGPFLAHFLKGVGWPVVFFSCAGIVSLNYLMLFAYPNIESGADPTESFGSVVVRTFKNLFQARLLTFLAIMTGFWLMMYQLWDLHPNFIVDWIDSSAMAEVAPEWLREQRSPRAPQISQEHMLNLNAFLIVLFVIPISAAVRKMKTLQAMLGGMIIATLGIVVSGLTQSGWMLLAGIALFSLGEMLTGPKKNEYLGLIAPPDRKALYLGYVNIPVGIGIFIGAPLASWLYANWGEKANLALQHLARHTDYAAFQHREWDGDMDTIAEQLGTPREDATGKLAEMLGQTNQQVTDLLWNEYAPYKIWFVFAAIGVVATLALILFNRAARNWKDMNY